MLSNENIISQNSNSIEINKIPNTEINNNTNRKLSNLNYSPDSPLEVIITKNRKNKKINKKIKYGRVFVCCYDKNGDLLLVIGPDIFPFLLLFSMNIFMVIFFSTVIISLCSLIIQIFGLIINFIQIYSFLLPVRKTQAIRN